MKDKFTEEEFRAAYDAANRRPLTGKPFIDKVIEELTRSEPEFSEGQIVMVRQPRNTKWYPRLYTEVISGEEVRGPNLTEHGQHVRDLRDAVEQYIRPTGPSRDVYMPMVEALARFDASVKDE